MQETFFQRLRHLDNVIEAGPSSCEYGRDLAPYIVDDATADYFFSRLSMTADSGWLNLLLKGGAFDELPAPVENTSKGTVRFPGWPQGQYLKSIADKAPRSVVDVVLRLPSTNNERVDACILEIALAFNDVEYSAQLVPRIVDALKKPLLLGLSLKVGSLISFLAKAGQQAASMSLVDAALAVDGDSTKSVGDSRETPRRNFVEPRAHIGLWEYEQIITRNLPDVVDAAHQQALDLLCGLLDRALQLSDRHGADDKPQDFSFIWRPAIEDHEQNINTGVKHLLVSAVRDAADQIAKADAGSIPAIVDLLEARAKSWLVFQRIALHLLALFPEANFSLVRNRLLDRALFNSAELRHEYFLLEKAAFGQLAGQDKRIMLTWIDQGPSDLDGISKRWAHAAGRPWSQDERDRYIRSWRRDRLAPLQEHLDAVWKKNYEELCRDGRPEHPEFLSYHTGGAWAPIGTEHPQILAKMSTSELNVYIQNWVPSEDEFRGPSREGLAGQITTLISESPTKYAAGAVALADIKEPIYVRAILQGFQHALRAGRDFEWSSIIDFCRLVVESRDQGGESGPDLGLTRMEVSRLLTEGFSSPRNSIPFEYRAKAWSAIESCTHDPRPTLEEEEEHRKNEAKRRGAAKKRDVSSSDPLSIAINSPRGVAIETVVEYGLWVRRNLERAENPKLGFGAMPEVEEIINSHLNREVDPSRSIRAVYGERAPWLQLLDNAWATRNTKRIFERGGSELWHTAWDTYIIYCAPYDNAFDWLRDEYTFAVEQIGQHDHGWGDTQAPDYALAKHLMAFYWRGKLDLESSSIVRFFQLADSALRGNALNFVGTSLKNTPNRISDSTAQRLKSLWMSRIEFAKRANTPSGDEMREFGWWFSSSQFDDDWSITQLLESLRIYGQTFPDHLVVQRLAEMANKEPRSCVEALKLIVEGDKEGWAILGWKEQAESIIRAAMRSGDARARSLAEDLINLVGSTRRLFEFGKLLEEPVT